MPKYEHSIADACFPILKAATNEGKALTPDDVAAAFQTIHALARSKGMRLLGRADAMRRLAKADPAKCADAIRRALARDGRFLKDADHKWRIDTIQDRLKAMFPRFPDKVAP